MQLFIEFEPLRQKLWAFMSSFIITTHQIFILCLILYQILGRGTKFGGNWLNNKKLQAKTKLGVENRLSLCVNVTKLIRILKTYEIYQVAHLRQKYSFILLKKLA